MEWEISILELDEQLMIVYSVFMDDMGSESLFYYNLVLVSIRLWEYETLF